MNPPEHYALQLLYFNITKSCNLACAFCYDHAVQQRTETLPLHIIEQLAADAKRCGMQSVLLSGGEPLLNPHWFEIAQIFDRHHADITIASNGTLITAQAAAQIASLQHATVTLSLDGDEVTHNRIRGGKDAFARTLAAMERLQQAGVPMGLNMVLSRDNAATVDAVVKVAARFTASLRLSLLHRSGERGLHGAGAHGFDAEEILAWRAYCRERQQEGLEVYMDLPPLLQFGSDIRPTSQPCGWARNACGVLANGDVTLCSVSSGCPELVAGNLHRERFGDIWQNAELFTRLRSFRVEEIKGICARCPYLHTCKGFCRVAAYRDGKDFFAPHDLCEYFYRQGYVPSDALTA
ncbi:MAG: radical SAM protein [Neisseria sp.]|nr:radical SAM protein [Neisseria sp.]